MPLSSRSAAVESTESRIIGADCVPRASGDVARGQGCRPIEAPASNSIGRVEPGHWTPNEWTAHVNH